MTLIQFEYIVALNKYGSFSEAAKKSFVTQPTLSMQIQKLEDELGVILFDRSKQPIKPTKIGLKIVAQAEIALRESAKITELIKYNHNQIAGTLKIGIIHTIAPYLLPIFITDTIKKYPEINFHIEELLTHEIIQKIRNETLDIGIISTPAKEEGIIELPLYYEPFVVYASDSHRLYKKTRIKAEEITLEDMWLLNEGHCFRSHALNLCGLENKNLKNLALEYKTGSLESITKIIELKYGYTLLPYLATIYMEKRKMKYVRQFSEPIPMREVGLVYKNSFLRKKVIKILQQQIQANLPEAVSLKKEGMVVDWV